MNLLKKIWKQIVNKTSQAPVLKVAEKAPECTASELLECVLEQDGASPWFVKLGAPQLFEEWYTGDLTDAAVRAAMPEFLQAHPAVSQRVGDKYK